MTALKGLLYDVFRSALVAGGIAVAVLLSGQPTAAAERTPWTGVGFAGTPDPPLPYTLQPAYPRLQFQNPVSLQQLPGTDRMLLLQLDGKLFTFVDADDASASDLMLDLQPLAGTSINALDVAAHPRFQENGWLFVVFKVAGDQVEDGERLVRFTVTTSEQGLPRIDPASRLDLFAWTAGGHAGCSLRFGPDGMLYFSIGDGSGPFPPDEYRTAQNLADVRGSICRIDVDHSTADQPYRVPDDNPFVDLPGARPEIWAFGFRNPWRMSFDPLTGDLLCGDVGWELWELVHRVQRGGNYGWSAFEGPQPIHPDEPRGPAPIVPPLVAYPHTDGQSVTGGFTVRRGTNAAGATDPLEGVYLYGDFMTGVVWGVRCDGQRLTWQQRLAETGIKIITFAQNHAADILLVDYAGTIRRLVVNDQPDRSAQFPRRLSDSGLLLADADGSLSAHRPASGVVAYQPAARMWSDGAETAYLLAVPGSEQIVAPRNRRQWRFPEGTVFAKTVFRQIAGRDAPQRRPLETQILHFDGLAWQPYSYVWDADGRDAALADTAGRWLDLTVVDSDTPTNPRPFRHRIHSRAECQSCHNAMFGGGVSFTLENLIASQRDVSSDSLAQLIQAGVFQTPPQRKSIAQAMVDPYDPSADLDARARSYLAINCAHCHQRGGGGTVALELGYSLAPDRWHALDAPPMQGAFGIASPSILTAGDPYHSVLYYRLATTGAGQMPKLSAVAADERGVALIHDWIVALGQGRSAAADDLLRRWQDPYSDAAATTAEAVTTAEALALDAAIRSGTPAAEVYRAHARRLASGGDAVIAGVLERYLPPAQRRQPLGSEIDPGQILAMAGDAERGRQWFAENAVGQCRACHRAAGVGQAVGPDLDTLGSKRTRSQLLDSLLRPSATIEPQYAVWTALTVDGRAISGIRVSAADDPVQLRSADGQLHTIAASEIDQLMQGDQSLMPDGQIAQMTARELADLLAYLASL